MIRPGYIAGALLALTGILLPADATIEFLRGTPVAQLEAGLHDQLQQGVLLFRVCLVLLGVATAIIVSLADRQHTGNSTMQATPSRGDILPVPVLIIAAIATAIRFYQLDAGLWVDEIMTYVNYANQPFGVLVSTYDTQNHHILYSLFTHASFLIFGESAWSLRLPAVLFGVGSILALYVLAREFVTRREALLSAALLAFSYHHVWFSQNARGYSALLLYSLLSSWMLVRALRERRLSLWTGYAVFAALGVYVHMTMLFMVIGHFLIFLWHRLGAGAVHWRTATSEFLAGFCMAGLLTITLYALVLPQLLGGTYLEGVENTIEIWTNPIWAILEVFRNLKIGLSGSLIAIIACLIFIVGLYRFYREQPLVAQLLLVPAAVTICVILLLGHPMFPRTFFFLMGFGAMIVIRGTLVMGQVAARLVRLRVSDPALPGTVLCIALIAVSAVSVPLAYAPKQDFTGALDYVRQHATDDDAVVTAGVAETTYKLFYKVDWPVTETVAELESIRSVHRRTWFVYTMPLHMKSAYPELWTSLENEFTIMQSFHGTLGEGTIFVAMSDKSPASTP